MLALFTKQIGLMNPVPPSQDEYDYMLILGGLATGVEPRVKYAAKLIEDGLKIRKQIAGLGSYRVLQEKELPISRKYAPDGRYEIDHLAAIIDESFDLRTQWMTKTEGDPTTDPRSASYVSELDERPHDRPTIATYAAPSSDPCSRPANTADTYELFAEHNKINASESALLVTSAIYLPYQHLDAARMLGSRGLTCETVGIVSVGTTLHPVEAYRQEIRSTLRPAFDSLGGHASLVGRQSKLSLDQAEAMMSGDKIKLVRILDDDGVEVWASSEHPVELGRVPEQDLDDAYVLFTSRARRTLGIPDLSGEVTEFVRDLVPYVESAKAALEVYVLARARALVVADNVEATGSEPLTMSGAIDAASVVIAELSADENVSIRSATLEGECYEVDAKVGKRRFLVRVDLTGQVIELRIKKRKS